VAPEYEKVNFGNPHEEEPRILASRADAIKTNALADAQSFTMLKSSALSERDFPEIGATGSKAAHIHAIKFQLFDKPVPLGLCSARVTSDHCPREPPMRANTVLLDYEHPHDVPPLCASPG
jgi:hypothetical protein